MLELTSTVNNQPTNLRLVRNIMKNQNSVLIAAIANAIQGTANTVASPSSMNDAVSHATPAPAQQSRHQEFDAIVDLAVAAATPLLVQTTHDGETSIFVDGKSYRLEGNGSIESLIAEYFCGNLPEGHSISSVFDNDDDDLPAVIFQVSRPEAVLLADQEVLQLEITAYEQEGPEFILSNGSITQVDSWLSTVHSGIGLSAVTGSFSKVVMDAAAFDLDEAGLHVVTVYEGGNIAALLSLGADAYVFGKPLQSIEQINAAVALAEHAKVLVCAYSHTAEDFLLLLESTGVTEDELNAHMSSILVLATVVPNEEIRRMDQNSIVLLSELSVFEYQFDVSERYEGTLPVRLLAMDAAEKVRSGLVPAVNAYEVVGEDLTTYL